MNLPLVSGKQQEKQQNKEQAQAVRVFVVLNPVAGFTDASAVRQTITRFCEEHHWQCDIHETAKDEDLRKLVRDYLKQGTDIVIAAGGDGTVSAVVSGMVNSRVPMGILPAGTGNVFARDLGIPLNLDGALNLLGDKHVVQELDIMEVSEISKPDYYVMNVSVGISSLIMRKTGREEKRRFGFLAYIYNAIGFILHSDLHPFLVKVDNKQLHISATEVMLANCKLMGLQPQFDGVDVNPHDGSLDMFIVRAKSLKGYLSVIARFIRRRKPGEDAQLRYLNVRKEIEIQSNPPMPVQADGEVIGKTPVKVRLVPGALRVIVPAKP